MKKKIVHVLVTIAGMINYGHLLAQVIPQEIRQVLPEKGIYRFPAFREGIIVFRDGTTHAAQLNFNVSLEEMHFLGDKGDTMAIADPNAISFIRLSDTKFYFDNGFLQTIDTTASNGILLAFRQTFSIQQRKKAGAYDMAPAHEGARTATFYGENGRPYLLEDDVRTTVTARELYFFGDEYGHFTRAGKGFLYDHFDKEKTTISDFLNNSHINFNNYQDLLNLMQFLKKLH